MRNLPTKVIAWLALDRNNFELFVLAVAVIGAAILLWAIRS